MKSLTLFHNFQLFTYFCNCSTISYSKMFFKKPFVCQYGEKVLMVVGLLPTQVLLKRHKFTIILTSSTATVVKVLSSFIHCSMMHCCCLQPDKVQEELNSVVGSRQMRAEDRKSLPYTDAVICEIQRMANIVPSLQRQAKRDVIFQDHFIKKVEQVV